MFSYFESLDTWGVFEEIEVSFLPVRHTHEKTDQAFSRFSKRVRSEDAATLAASHGFLQHANKSCARVAHMR